MIRAGWRAARRRARGRGGRVGPADAGRATRFVIAVGVGLLLLPLGDARAKPGDEKAGTARERRPTTWQSAPKVPESWHATAFVRGDVGLRVIDYWSKGSNMRARTLIAGRPVTTLVRGDRYVVFDGLTRRGIEIRRSPRALEEDAGRVRPFAFEHEELLRDGAEKIEEVSLGRVRGEIWQVTDARGRRKVWVTAEAPRVPVRVETFDRATSVSVDLDYSNWIFDLEMSSAFFSPPSDVALQAFGYDEYLKKVLEGPVSPLPILYPDLLHGSPPD